MLTVVKRSGREEPFDGEKIKASLAIASDELGEPLNNADLKRLGELLAEQFSSRERISSQEVYQTVVHLLEEEGFHRLSKAYGGNKEPI